MNLFYILCFYITVSCIASINTSEIPHTVKSQAKKLRNLCQKEVGIANEQMAKIVDNDNPNDRNIQCYVHCLFDKVGLIDSANQMHLEYLIDILPDSFHSIVQELAQSCGTQPGADGCETAYLTAKCYYNVKPSLREQLSFMFT